ncbi:hypothetical protein BDR03DRAFT_956660 [Suillus americanus]|nr:hypothetical protein BDR03DRAFT_956660 [Suillus americanus]
MSVVIIAILCGKLPHSNTSVILTRIKYHASHCEQSVTCHVSTIEKDAHLSHRNLPTCHDRLRSVHCNSKQPCFWR